MKRYNLVVIGSGPAGEKAAVQAAYLGQSVVVIDAGLAGGAWVNTGTIPSKTLRETALYLAGGRSMGLSTPFGRERSVANLMSMERRIVSRWREKVERGFRGHQVDRMTGRAHFIDPHTVALDSGEQVAGDFILIATGSRPRPVDFAPVDGQRIHDSDSILRISEIPETLIVLGGGVIACEYASIMQALGVQVTLLNSRDRLLGWLDLDAAAMLQTIFEQAGMVVRHHARAIGTQKHPNGVSVQLDDGTLAQADMCFLGLGRVPNTEGLGLSEAGVAQDDRGAIEVDGFSHKKEDQQRILSFDRQNINSFFYFLFANQLILNKL